MFKRIVKAYRRHMLRRAIKSLGPTAEILCYNASDNSFIVRYKAGKTPIRSKVYYRPSDRTIVFDSEFYDHPDF
jgi:hypothetical protein